ncbi:MAG: hypothetical protein IKY34_07035 [Ruminiclostridium sp.]|nr:hypothetical protein [Ruminiclostridium sp.]
MRISRINKIFMSLRKNGNLAEESFREIYIPEATNITFYKDLSLLIESKRKMGIAKTVIDECLIPQELWKAGIWEQNITISGIAVFESAEGMLDSATISLDVQTGCNPALLSSRNIDYDDTIDVIKVRNIETTIFCSTIQFKTIVE